MKQKPITTTLNIIALAIISSVLLHGNIMDISIFHGLIVHPIFILIGFVLLITARKT